MRVSLLPLCLVGLMCLIGTRASLVDEYDEQLAKAAQFHPLGVPVARISSMAKHLYDQALLMLRPLSLQHYHWKHVDPNHGVQDSLFHQLHRLTGNKKNNAPVVNHHTSRLLKDPHKQPTKHSRNSFTTMDSSNTSHTCKNGGAILNDSCICPTDFSGDSCEERRHFRCKIYLVSSEGAQPQTCSGSDELTTPDLAYTRQCRYVSLDESALSTEFYFRYSCELAYHNVSQMFIDNPGSDNLDYSFVNLSQNLIFSKVGTLQVRVKVYNFNRLYDDSQVYAIEYTTYELFNQMQQIKVSVDPAQIPKRFATGNRIYIEMTPNSTTLPLVDGNTYQVFLDVAGSFKKPPYSLSTSAIIAIVCVPFVFIVGSFYGYQFWKKYKSTHQYQHLLNN